MGINPAGPLRPAECLCPAAELGCRRSSEKKHRGRAPVVQSALRWTSSRHPGICLAAITSLASFEMGARQLRLSDDARKCAPLQRIVKGNRNRNRRAFEPFLHDTVASAQADRDESVPFENPANLAPRKDAKLPNRDLNLRDENFAAGTARNFGRVGGLEEQRKRFCQIRSGFLDRRALAGNVEFGTERHKSIVFSLDNGGKAKGLRHDPSLHQFLRPDKSPSRTTARRWSGLPATSRSRLIGIISDRNGERRGRARPAESRGSLIPNRIRFPDGTSKACPP